MRWVNLADTAVKRDPGIEKRDQKKTKKKEGHVN